MGAVETYLELRTRLLEARTSTERLRALTATKHFLTTLPEGSLRTTTLLLLAHGHGEPVGRWRTVLTYAAAAASQIHHAPRLASHVALVRGIAYLQTGHHAAAVALLDEALSDLIAAGDPNVGAGGLWRVEAHLACGDLTGATHAANLIPPTNHQHHTAQAEIAAARHDWEAARLHARASLANPDCQHPHNITERISLLRILARCAQSTGDAQARRLALIEAARLTLIIRHGTQARLMLTLEGTGGEQLDSARADQHRSERLRGVAHSGIPGDGNPLRRRDASAPARLAMRQQAA